MKLISTGNCKKPLRGVDIRGEDLTGANLSQANLINANLGGVNLTGVDLDSAIKCKTIFPWGEDNLSCK